MAYDRRSSGSCGYRGRRYLVCCPTGNNEYDENEPKYMYGGDFYERPYRPRRGQENKLTPNQPFPNRNNENQKQSISDESKYIYIYNFFKFNLTKVKNLNKHFQGVIKLWV